MVLHFFEFFLESRDDVIGVLFKMIFPLFNLFNQLTFFSVCFLKVILLIFHQIFELLDFPIILLM